MTQLEYKMTNDALFKMVFVQHQELLKRLIAQILCISLDNITEFVITNSEMPPDIVGGKFCHLDINMKVNGQRVALEVQLLSEKSDNRCYPSRNNIRVGMKKQVKIAV